MSWALVPITRLILKDVHEGYSSCLHAGSLTLNDALHLRRWSVGPSILFEVKVPVTMWICLPLPDTGHLSMWWIWPHQWPCVLTSAIQS